jgi:hypothetical protein
MPSKSFEQLLSLSFREAVFFAAPSEVEGGISLGAKRDFSLRSK